MEMTQKKSEEVENIGELTLSHLCGKPEFLVMVLVLNLQTSPRLSSLGSCTESMEHPQ